MVLVVVMFLVWYGQSTEVVVLLWFCIYGSVCGDIVSGVTSMSLVVLVMVTLKMVILVVVWYYWWY